MDTYSFARRLWAALVAMTSLPGKIPLLWDRYERFMKRMKFVDQLGAVYPQNHK